ncbi:MAG: 50S ribosomal protein L20 [Candidatus Hodgkinia cicadicola]
MFGSKLSQLKKGKRKRVLLDFAGLGLCFIVLLMSRTTRGVTARKRHKRALLETKGYKGRRKSTIKIAKQATLRAMSNRATSVRLSHRRRKVYVTKRTNELLNNHQFNYKTISYAFNRLKLGLSFYAALRIAHQLCGAASIFHLTANV